MLAKVLTQGERQYTVEPLYFGLPLMKGGLNLGGVSVVHFGTRGGPLLRVPLYYTMQVMQQATYIPQSLYHCLLLLLLLFLLSDQFLLCGFKWHKSIAVKIIVYSEVEDVDLISTHWVSWQLADIPFKVSTPESVLFRPWYIRTSPKKTDVGQLHQALILHAQETLATMLTQVVYGSNQAKPEDKDYVLATATYISSCSVFCCVAMFMHAHGSYSKKRWFEGQSILIQSNASFSQHKISWHCSHLASNVDSKNQCTLRI